MKRLMQITVAAVVVALAVGPAVTQEKKQRQRPGGGRGFGGGTLFLLQAKSVQEELKLSGDQVKKITELAEKQRSAMKDVPREERRAKREELAKANNKAIGEILKPEQLKRVKQIALQQQGVMALTFNEEVAKALKISEDQKDKIREIQSKMREEMRGAFGDQEKMQKLRKQMSEKVMGVLTAEQKTKLKEMQGEPFKGEIPRPQFGGGRGGRSQDKQG
jgi:Spy/CpxP family protein refolding chaperone